MFRRLGDPFGGFFRLSGIGKGQNPGFRWNQFATFEAGLTTPNPTGWDAVVTGAGGAVAVNAAAAYQGNFGFQSSVNGLNSLSYGRFDDPDGERTTLFQFYFNIGTLNMGVGDSFRVLIASHLGGVAPVNRSYEFAFVNVGAGIQLRGFVFRNGGGQFLGTLFTPAVGWHLLKICWKASDPGQSNGLFSYSYDGQMLTDIRTVDNSLYDIDDFRLGGNLQVDAGTTGNMYFDNIGWANRCR